jgi:predicted permease
MRWLRDLTFFLRHLDRRRAEQELDDEIRAHIEIEVQAKIDEGMPPELARRAALRSFGNVALATEDSRSEWGFKWLEATIQDIRYATRSLRKSPAFTSVVMLSLALGIGANTAIFSITSAVLLNPLPYKDPDELALIRVDVPGLKAQPGIAAAEIIDLRNQSRTLQDLAVIVGVHASLTGEHMERVPGASVGENLLPLLGIQPALGRNLSEKEDGGTAHVTGILISHELWQRRLGGVANVVGRGIEINNFLATVVGVLPRGFRLYLGPDTNVQPQIDIWFPGSLTENSLGTDRESRFLTTIGRLKPGATAQRAQADLDDIAAEMVRAHPKAYEGGDLKFHVVPLHQDLVKDVRVALLALTFAVLFVLLIACVNAANMMLARAMDRRRDLAVRAALGAGRGRIIRQVLTESLLLGLLSGAAGLLLARWGTTLSLHLLPASLPRQDNIAVGPFVLVFALILSLMAGVASGLGPAWQATKSNMDQTLKGSSRRVSAGPGKLRSALVVSEVAMAVVLLAGAFLMLRTVANLARVNTGLRPDHLLTLEVDTDPGAFGPDEHWRFYARAVDRVRTMPGVEAVSGVFPLPLAGVANNGLYAASVESPPQSASLSVTLPDYFSAMGITLLAGRDFTAADNDQNHHVAIVDEDMVRQCSPEENPLGKTILLGPTAEDRMPVEIVGVVKHVLLSGLRDQAKPQIYLPYRSFPVDLTLTVRTTAAPQALAAQVRKEVEGLGGRRPVHNVRAMTDYVSDTLAASRFEFTVLGVFAALALMLCAAGLYGVISYSVSQRTQEIGIRVALGARRTEILRLVIGHGLTMVGLGLAAGLFAAALLTQAMSSLLFGVGAMDPLSFCGVLGLLAMVATAACYLPARKAASVDPVIALRFE